VKKEKWRVFSKEMDFIKALDKGYDPLQGPKFTGDRVNKLMAHFPAIMEALAEKKIVLISKFPKQAGRILKEMASKPVINPGQYSFEKKENYVVVRPISTFKR
jgi:hypothetical protein